MKNKRLKKYRHVKAIERFDEILQESSYCKNQSFVKGVLVGPYRVALLNLKCKIAIDVEKSAPVTGDYTSQETGKYHFLTGLGYKLIRFTEQQIYEQPEHVLRVIEEAVEKYGK